MITQFDKEIYENIHGVQFQGHYLSSCFFSEVEKIPALVNEHAFPEEVLSYALGMKEKDTQQTLLHKAAAAGLIPVIDWLLTTDLNPFLKDSSQKTAFDYAENDDQLITLFLNKNLLIGVENVTIKIHSGTVHAVIGDNIRFLENKPDCIKGPKSYQRLKAYSSEEQLIKRFEQFLEAASKQDRQKGYTRVVKNILAVIHGNPLLPAVKHSMANVLTWKEKKQYLLKRKQAFLDLAYSYNDLLKNIDEDMEFRVPENLSELKQHQENLLAPASCWATTGTLIGCIPCMAFLGCLVLTQTPPKGAPGFYWLGFNMAFYLASLPLTWIPAGLCALPWVISRCSQGNAAQNILYLEEKKQLAESEVCELFEQQLQESKYLGEYVIGHVKTRSDLVEAMDKIRTLINQEIIEFDQIVNQSRVLGLFFKKPQTLLMVQDSTLNTPVFSEYSPLIN